MKRRAVLEASLALPLATLARTAQAEPWRRVRPSDAAWPSAQEWSRLRAAVNGHLSQLASPFKGCTDTSCEDVLAQMKNPFFVGDQPALTQTSGWLDAWASQPSAYAVAAESAAEVAAAVRFAREKRLRLVVKGGGHSYLGTSDAPDSLLVWTRRMNAVELHEAFVPQGCKQSAPQPAVSLQAGAMWSDAYDAVTTQAGRYVQGGGCTTVGVAGLVQSGGFGSFSKRYGMAAAGLLEAEVVTADGEIRIANACQHPELFWALKGGGGGSLGVVTRLTLRTHELPQNFGAVFGSIQASTDEDYRALIAEMIAFYARALFNPHWGEQIKLEGEKTLGLSLVFQGLGKAEAEAVWAPFVEWLKARPQYQVLRPIQALALPARQFWNAEFMQKYLPPGVMVNDPRPGAPKHHAAWGGDLGQVGWFIHGYHSAWMPASLLEPRRQQELVDALYECKRHWDVALHLNKGLAGAPDDAIEAARDTATNPQVLGAFALAICAGGGAPAYPGMPGQAPDVARANRRAATMKQGMQALMKAAPEAGAYVSESDYFLKDWQRAYWGENYPRLLAAKQKYDPEGLFFVHHGVGSEGWSADGFTRLA